MRFAWSIVVTLLMIAQAAGQTLTLPDKIAGQPWDFVPVPAKTEGKVVKWVSLDGGLKLFPVDLLKDTKTAIVSADVGTYRLLAYTAINSVPSDPAICTIVIGTPGPPVPPTPKPDPPVPPKPDDSPLNGSGARVLFIVETTTGEPLLPSSQKNEIFGKEIADYLNAKCVKEGSSAAWRVYDKDQTFAANSPPWWKLAMSRPRTSLPWLIVTNGTRTIEIPMPAGGQILGKIKSVLEAQQ